MRCACCNSVKGVAHEVGSCSEMEGQTECTGGQLKYWGVPAALLPPPAREGMFCGMALLTVSEPTASAAGHACCFKVCFNIM